MPPALQPALECRLRCLDALDAPLVEAVLRDEFEGEVCECADVGEEGAVGFFGLDVTINVVECVPRAPGPPPPRGGGGGSHRVSL